LPAEVLDRPRHDAANHAGMPTWLMLLNAAACGLIVANLYYVQPLVGPIRAAIGLPAGAAGLLVTLTQLGYCAGLLLVVPLGDLVENRRLVLALVAVLVVALVAAPIVPSLGHPVPAFLACSLVIGFGAVAVQVLVPYASHMAPEHVRGRVVGNIVSGLMFGIMLARPVASFITHMWSWQGVYALSAVLMVLLGIVLRMLLPARRPHSALGSLRGYCALLASMGGLVRDLPVLRRRAIYQAGMFGAFSVFWTVVPLLLASPAYGMNQRDIAWFALAGVAGTIAAPVAGRVADRGWTRPATAFCMLLGLLSFVPTLGAAGGGKLNLGLLVAAAIALDFAVSGNLVLGQRTIYALGAEVRGRVNGLYMATFFVGGATGSALGAWSFAHGGWQAACAVGMGSIGAVLLVFLTEPRGITSRS
jgi:predicted MFS family arabinose efflux permease